VQQRVVAGDLDEMRTIVEALAQDFDVLDIAAAALALAHTDGDAQTGEPPAIEPPVDRPGRKSARAASRDTVHIEINVGKASGVRPADLVGAIAGEARISSRELGAIRILASRSLVEVPASLAARIVEAVRGAWIRNRKVVARIHEP
jgi:ATP-dependent RNA helicase DeaD